MSIELTVYCNTCGAELKTTAVADWCAIRQNEHTRFNITAEPCESCLTEAHNEGWDEGHDKGVNDYFDQAELDEAVSNALAEGKAEGYSEGLAEGRRLGRKEAEEGNSHDTNGAGASGDL